MPSAHCAGSHIDEAHIPVTFREYCETQGGTLVDEAHLTSAMLTLVREARVCTRTEFEQRHPGWYLLPPPRSLHSRAQAPTLPRMQALSRMPTEAITDHEPALPAAVFSLRARSDGRPIHVGRTDENDVVISDLTVSRRHAAFILGASRVEMIDLGSRNGTRVRGIALRSGESQRLYSGDAVTIGSVLLLVVDAKACWETLIGTHR